MKKYIKYTFKNLPNYVGCVVSRITCLRGLRGFLALWAEWIELLRELRGSKYFFGGSTFYLSYKCGLVLVLKITFPGALKPLDSMRPLGPHQGQPSQKPPGSCCFFRASKPNLLSQGRRLEKILKKTLIVCVFC